MRALECNRDLLNPTFEGYKLQPLDTEASGTLIADSSSLPNKISFELNNDGVSKRSLTYSELKWGSQFNHAQLKLTLGSKESIVLIDSDFNVLWIECSKGGRITTSVLASIKAESFPSGFLTLPTIKLLQVDETGASLIACSGRSKAFMIDISCEGTAKVTSNFTLPSAFSSGNQELWAFMDAYRCLEDSSYRIVSCVKTVPSQEKFAIVVIDIKKDEQRVICNIKGDEFPLMINFTPEGTGFYVASKKQFGVEVKAPITTLPQPDLPYTWLQTSDDVTVYFTLKHAIEVKALKCVLKDDTFFLEEASSMLEPLERGWFGRIQSKESAWTIENGRWLTLHLEKADKGTRWSSLFDFEDGVLEALDPNELAEIRENLEKYTGNPRPRYALQQPFGSEIEQVDFEGEDVYLTIHDLEGHRQQTFTSSGMSWLGVSLVESNFSAPRFILRYDVDALVFDADPPFRHSSTFDAMGYVQASKRNCKMLVLSSDLNLMMIVECHSNIYLYGKSSPSFRRWAPQAVIQVPSDSPIQGVQLMYNKYLLVLTQCEAFLLDLGGFIRA